MHPNVVKRVVHISNHWHNPGIEVRIHEDAIAIEISLEDFCKAIAADMAHPAFTFTRAGLEAKILASVEGVLNKVKESSRHI